MVHILFVATLEVPLLPVEVQYFYIQSKTDKLSSGQSFGNVNQLSRGTYVCVGWESTRSAQTTHTTQTTHTAKPPPHLLLLVSWFLPTPHIQPGRYFCTHLDALFQLCIFSTGENAQPDPKHLVTQEDQDPPRTKLMESLICLASKTNDFYTKSL